MFVKRKHQGFTLIELVAVIVILGVLAAVALPRFTDLGTAAKQAALQGIAGTMRSAANLAKAMARAQGLKPLAANPGNQSQFIIPVGNSSAEVDYRNLCPESRAELGGRLSMVDYINLTTGSMTSRFDNQYTFVGFDLPNSASTSSGCYVLYDSFGDPDCTITVVTVDC